MSDQGSTSDGRLTTHVLDTAKGIPAAGLKVELRRLDDSGSVLITTMETNADGRVDRPLMSGADMAAGTYELLFHAGAYLRRQDLDLTEPLFLDLVPVRFGINEPSAHYHVPLLLSPFGYSTYRGS